MFWFWVLAWESEGAGFCGVKGFAVGLSGERWLVLDILDEAWVVGEGLVWWCGWG